MSSHKTANTVKTSNEGAVRIVTMNRPKALNALNGELMDDLTDAFLNAASDDSVRVMVLTGSGRAFSAGADLAGNRDYQPRHGFDGMLAAMVDFPKPMIAAVNGLGVGYGATVCGLADIVYMARSARLRTPFSMLGLTAELASTYTFPRLMGRQRASWFLLSSEWMSADECLAAGLALEVVDDEQLMAHALAQAGKLGRMPLASLLTTKRLMMDPLRPQLKASIKAENAGLAELSGGPANREAVAAFLEKREPDFSKL